MDVAETNRQKKEYRQRCYYIKQAIKLLNNKIFRVEIFSSTIFAETGSDFVNVIRSRMRFLLERLPIYS